MRVWLRKNGAYDNNHGVDERFGTVKTAASRVCWKQIK